MKNFKDMNLLEKIGAWVIASPIAAAVIVFILTAGMLYDGFIFQQIWNLLMPKLFTLPDISLLQSMAINVLIGYQKFSSYKETRKTSYLTMIFVPLTFWAMAYVLHLFI